MTDLTFIGLKQVLAAIMIAASAVTAFADDAVPAKQLFGHVALPTKGPARPVGFYAKGCQAGAVAIPVNGPAWQVLHLSRNRRWGNPRMIALLERLSRDGRAKDGWPGLLVGDISQPRGGPMLSGHASHQIGLDADVWLTPMPDRPLNYQERENFPENSMLKAGTLQVDPRVWTQAHANIIMQAASYPEVERIFVHPGIKKKLCQTWTGDRTLLSKVRPMYGHNYHFHIRIKCPPGTAGCTSQAPPPSDDGCGKSLAWWFTDEPWGTNKPKPPVKKPTKPVKPWALYMNNLPKACAMVLDAPSVTSAQAAEYHPDGGQQMDDDTASAMSYAAQPASSAAFASVGDFSGLVPTGPVPIPRARP